MATSFSYMVPLITNPLRSLGGSHTSRFNAGRNGILRTPRPMAFGSFFSERAHEPVQGALEQRWPEQLSNPHKPIAPLSLIFHPCLAHPLEGSVAHAIHQPAICDAGPDVGHEMASNAFLVIALTEQIPSGQHTRPHRHAHPKTPHKVLKST